MENTKLFRLAFGRKGETNYVQIQITENNREWEMESQFETDGRVSEYVLDEIEWCIEHGYKPINSVDLKEEDIWNGAGEGALA